VPDIALTPQTLDRFSSRFPGRVALLHSRLSAGEHYDEWARVRDSEVDVVVGSRSAIFAPMPDLGLIVVDEDHEWSYKQGDLPPRYHARDVALRLGRAYRATVILGSATPDVTTYEAARSGDLKLVELNERVTGGLPPPVEVVDMRSELKSGNRSIFSRLLHGALAANLGRGEQSILYLNRRGSASVVLCRSCGYYARCRRCSTVLTYHSTGEDLVCHTCNLRQKAPEECPNCHSRYIRFLGSGTQSVAGEVGRLFPSARVARLDSDIGGRNAHQSVIQSFAAGEIDILVGTQLVAKGHDLPGVSLVGVVNADVGLFLPDFRAGERVFQLLTQVAGRPGRQGGGQTIIQTYSPDHYVVKAAAMHDYRGFYDQEIRYRKERRYPPYATLARLLYPHRSEQAAIRAAGNLHDALVNARSAHGMSIDILGPAPAYFRRVRGRYRWQLVLRGDDVVRFLNIQSLPNGWVVDVDPLTLL
jgi:primosomal protein N' (replication factor Y)